MEIGLDLQQLPRYCGSAHKIFRPGEKHVTRVFDSDVLIVMQAGELQFREAGHDVTLGPGEYYIQRRNLLQEGTQPCTAEYDYVHFTGSFAPGGMPLRGRADIPGLAGYFRQLERLQFAGGSAVEKAAVFFSLLSALKCRALPAAHSDLVRQILALLSDRLSGDCSLETLARLCGYSKNHIIRIFRRETGQTPYAYLLERRLDTAERLLLHSDRTAAEIAEETGFGSYLNFYKQFRKRRGCAPQVWRSRRLGDPAPQGFD